MSLGLLERRACLKGIGAAASILSLRAFAADPEHKYSKKVMDLVERVLVVDMLGPLKLDFRPEAYAEPLSEQDAAMFRICGITAFHNSVGVGGPNAYDEALQFICAWSGFAGRNSDVFSLVGIAADLDQAKAKHKIAVIMGLQNAEQFREPKDVKEFYQLGLRCAQLTYNSQNYIGSGSTDRVDGGISDYGVEIIKAMNEVGMLIDVSHSGDRTTLDAIELSPRPIAFTHSNCRALNNHPRLKTDEAIQKLARKGGRHGHHRSSQFREGPRADDRRGRRRPHRPRSQTRRYRARRHRHGSEAYSGITTLTRPVRKAQGGLQSELRLPRQIEHRRSSIIEEKSMT